MLPVLLKHLLKAQIFKKLKLKKKSANINTTTQSIRLKRIFMKVSLMAQMVKKSPAMQETQVPSLGWEDPLEKGMATHSSILAWRIPWREESGKL